MFSLCLQRLNPLQPSAATLRKGSISDLAAMDEWAADDQDELAALFHASPVGSILHFTL